MGDPSRKENAEQPGTTKQPIADPPPSDDVENGPVDESDTESPASEVNTPEL
jgi:hypothetical protein